jgi:uncharacterized phage protein gp47/JayE
MSRITNLIRRLTDVYNREPSGNNYKILSIDGSMYEDINDMLEDVLSSHFIGEATGVSLDGIAKLVGLTRETAEADDQFRARILARVQGFIGGGTKLSIQTAVAEFLGVLPGDVLISDGYLDAGAYGHFSVQFNIGTVQGVGQSYVRLVALINSVKAAGTILDNVSYLISEHVHVTESYGLTVTDDWINENSSVSENTPANMFLHRADMTFSDSLNVIQ